MPKSYHQSHSVAIVRNLSSSILQSPLEYVQFFRHPKHGFPWWLPCNCGPRHVESQLSGSASGKQRSASAAAKRTSSSLSSRATQTNISKSVPWATEWSILSTPNYFFCKDSTLSETPFPSRKGKLNCHKLRPLQLHQEKIYNKSKHIQLLFHIQKQRSSWNNWGNIGVTMGNQGTEVRTSDSASADKPKEPKSSFPPPRAMAAKVAQVLLRIFDRWSLHFAARKSVKLLEGCTSWKKLTDMNR